MYFDDEGLDGAYLLISSGIAYMEGDGATISL